MYIYMYIYIYIYIYIYVYIYMYIYIYIYIYVYIYMYIYIYHAGRRPTRPTAVMKENGRLAQCPEEVRARWHQHFVKILNIPCAFNDEVIDTLPLLPPHLHLDMPPTEEELMQALTKLKMRKAGGKSGVCGDC